MTAFVSIFGASILLTAGFFTFKDWERQRGRETGITAFLRRHSPSAERVFRTVVAHILFWVRTVARTIGAAVSHVFHRVLTFFRTGVVVFAAHMIQAARGEHLMAEGKIPSTYFKLLHRHKERINGDEIPHGIAKPDVLRKVKITTEDESGSAEASPQVQ